MIRRMLTIQYTIKSLRYSFAAWARIGSISFSLNLGALIQASPTFSPCIVVKYGRCSSFELSFFGAFEYLVWERN